MHKSEETVTVYRVQVYDVTTDDFRLSRRMATPEGAVKMGGEIIGATAVVVPVSALEAGEEWTPRDFNPNAATGFQRQIK
jgi:hypothetical protein